MTLATARTVGERILAAYEAAGFNRSQFMHEMGVAYTTILAWERDKSAPTLDHLLKLSVLTKVPASVLLGEDAPMTEAQYLAWADFLQTGDGRSMTQNERIALGSMRFAADDTPSADRYRALLVALRGTALR